MTFCGPNHVGLGVIIPLFSCRRPGRSSLGLPGRGVRPAGQHRTFQQSTLRQEPQQPGLPACGQLPAKRSGTAGGLTRRLPNELWPLAGAGGLLQTYLMGRTATVRLINCTRPPTWNKTGRTNHSDRSPINASELTEGPQVKPFSPRTNQTLYMRVSLTPPTDFSDTSEKRLDFNPNFALCASHVLRKVRVWPWSSTFQHVHFNLKDMQSSYILNMNC